MIRKIDKKYCVLSKDGKRKFGCFKTRANAVRRLQQVEYFKNRK